MLNQDLWFKLLPTVEKHDVSWTWVRGHAGNPYNERCHTLAVRACQTAIDPPPPGSWLNPSKKKKEAAAPEPGSSTQGEARVDSWNDAEMRMKSEVARRPTCPECGFSNGDHARMCSRR